MPSWYQLLPLETSPINRVSLGFQREVGRQVKVKRSFQATWFQRWNWLLYDESHDVVFCHLCVKAYQEKKLSSGSIDHSFICNGFSNWKDACNKFKAHECSKCHKDSVEKILTLPRTTHDIGEALSSIHKQEKLQRQQVLLKLQSNVH